MVRNNAQMSTATRTQLFAKVARPTWFCYPLFVCFVACSSTSSSSTADDAEIGGDSTVEVGTDSQVGDAATEDSGPVSATPIYVTVGTHIEFRQPFGAGCTQYERVKGTLLDFAALFQEFGVKWNLQSSGTFAARVVECDDGAGTDGKNILVYLNEQPNVLIDAHTHDLESEELYADVVAELLDAGIPESSLTVAGGFVTNDQDQYNRFVSGQTGTDHPDYTWRPEVVSYAAVPAHAVEDEDFTSGMWRPSAFDYPDSANPQYYIHDPDVPFAVAGMGFLHSCDFNYRGYFWQASDYVIQLAEFIADGTAEPAKMYTATIATTQTHIDEAERSLPKIRDQFEELAPLVESGQVVYAHFQELPGIWEAEYDSAPNIFTIDNFDPEEHHTCANGRER